MRRFFTKSRVAFIIVISIAVFCFAFGGIINTNLAHAQNLPGAHVPAYNADGSLKLGPTGQPVDAYGNQLTPAQLETAASGSDFNNLTSTQQIELQSAVQAATGIDQNSFEDQGGSTYTDTTNTTTQTSNSYYTAYQAYQQALQNGDPRAYINYQTAINAIKGSEGGTINTIDPTFFDILKDTTGKVLGKVFTGLANTVAFTISIVLELITIPIASVFLAISGKLLDFVIQFSINGQSFNTFATIINNLWVLVRDIFNVAFIFILLYVAISKILRLTSVDTKKMLISVIISAVFINFSFFITRILIDAGNIVSMALYSQIENSSLISTQNLSTTGFTSGLVSGLGATPTSGSTIYLSEILANNLDIQTMYDDSNNFPSFGTSALIKSFLRLTIIVITIFIFFWMIFLLLGRFVMLMFLMVSAPLGFVGKSIPWVGDYSKDWWKELINQVVLAPIFMFLMLLVLQVAIQSKSITGSKDSFMIYFKYILIIYLLFKTVQITKKFSGEVGDIANKVAKAATGAALAAATGGTALIARQTIGRGASALSQRYAGRLNTLTSSNNILVSGAGKALTSGLKKTAQGTMDVRNTGTIAKETIGILNKKGGIDLTEYAKAGGTYGKGKEAKGGFEGWKEEQKRQVETQAKAYEKTSQSLEKELSSDLEDMNKKRVEMELKKNDPKTSTEDKMKLAQQIENLKQQIETKKANMEAADPNKMRQKAEETVTTNPKISSIQEGISNRMKEKAELEKKLENLKNAKKNLHPDLTPEEQGYDSQGAEAEIKESEEKLKRLDKTIAGENELANDMKKVLVDAEIKKQEQAYGGIKNYFNAEAEIFKRRNLKKRYAEQVRTRFVTSLNKISTLGLTKEDQNLSAAALKAEAPKEKTPAEKEDERIKREAYEKAAKESYEEKPPEVEKQKDK